jgi:hypothetical protein
MIQSVRELFDRRDTLMTSELVDLNALFFRVSSQTNMKITLPDVGLKLSIPTLEKRRCLFEAKQIIFSPYHDRLTYGITRLPFPHAAEGNSPTKHFKLQK